ncbi:carbohydrate ABC transporter permease [Gorillibacterium sp. sgz5001074]|uniref:carbohydrate ABC transporter permease n=1 Tax=Gorillibacterium sp. sgz5001074 TaxID=3446695 RepID=UPI003F666C02
MANPERGIISRYDMKRGPVKVFYSLMVAVIAIMVFSMLYPLLVTFFNGLKPNEEVNSFPPRLLPSVWEWGNYQKGWTFINLPLFTRNTLLIFGGNLVMTVLVLGLAAFSLSRLAVPWRRAVLAFFLSTLFIPPTTYLIPNFLNLKDLGLVNTFAAFWLPAAANAFYLLLLKSFFDEIHQEMFEAARIDGASEWRCFIGIAVPLSVPIFTTLSIFVFSTAWNDWFWPSLVMHSDKKYPLATAINRYVINARRLDTNVRFAILTMVMVPPMGVFLLFQKYIMRGLQLGGVKG